MTQKQYDKTISIEMNSGMLEKLDLVAENFSLNRTEIIRQAIAEFLDPKPEYIHDLSKKKYELGIVYTSAKTKLNLNEIATKTINHDLLG